MKVVFYTATCFLDVSLEILNILKKRVELHVLIEIKHDSRQHNIVDIENLPDNEILVSPRVLLNTEQYKAFEPYLTGLSSVHFVVHSKARFSSLKVSYHVCKFIRTIRPDVFHLEAMMIRSVGLIPAMLGCRKVMISIHDPIPHTGEGNRLQRLTNFIFFHLPVKKGFFFYSEFAKQVFTEHYSQITGKKYVIKMARYSFFEKLLEHPTRNPKHILFFGRLSAYKGIDILLKAMPKVFAVFPSEVLILAGKSFGNYEISQNLVEGNKQILVLNKHIANFELVDLISRSKFVVCPYLDATQSGVIMTAFALGRPVVATRVGAMPEYIEDNVNGLLIPPNNVNVLADSIIQALQGDHFKKLAANIELRNESNPWESNISVLIDSYED